MVAPAPARPPKNPDMIFPIPWPIDSLLGKWLDFVILSATTDVNKLSIIPREASITEKYNISGSSTNFGMYIEKLGMPEGMYPINAWLLK